MATDQNEQPAAAPPVEPPAETPSESQPVTASAQPESAPAQQEAVPAQTEAPPKTEETKKNEKGGKQDKKKDNAKADSAAGSGSPKLTGAELKAKAKAEKAARRAQVKSSKDQAKGEAAVSSNPVQLGPSAAEVKAGKGKGRQDGGAGVGSKAPGARTAVPVAPVEPKNIIPECFSHLSMARRLPMTQADKDVHPTVLALGQQMATFAIDESILRLKATLLAFKKVITSYNTPPGNTLARHLTPHVLNPQIEYLTACRPMCFSMGNAIRWLKLQVSKIDPDVAEHEAKKVLCESIDNFIQERITMADLVIMEQAGKKIRDGDVLLTHGRSTLIERTLLSAFQEGKKFTVFIVDDPYARTGQQLAKTLTAAGIKVTYSGDFGGLRSHIHDSTKVILSAESMFNNGSMYGRSGFCDVAIAAKEVGRPVIALCETINITERVTTDSVTYNEIDPERSSAAAFRLLFDTTPAQFLSMVITELGSVQPTSVSDLLRKLEESN